MSIFTWTPGPWIYLMYTIITLLLSPKTVLHLPTSLLPKKINKQKTPKAPTKQRNKKSLKPGRCRITQHSFTGSLWSLKTSKFSFWNLNIILLVLTLDLKLPSIVEDSVGVYTNYVIMTLETLWVINLRIKMRREVLFRFVPSTPVCLYKDSTTLPL